MRIVSLLSLAALGVAVAGLCGQEPRQGTPRQRATANDEAFSDKMFVEKAAVGGMFEVQTSQLAQQMATSPAVKRFAARMVTDHTKANRELTTLARQKGWRVPTAMDRKHQEKLDELRKAGGAGATSGQFDRAYMDIQVTDHDEDVPLFEKAAQEGQDADLKAWAAKTLPTLKEHQQLAHQIGGQLNPGGAAPVQPGGRTRPVPPR
jgi:putative membrane protein